MIFESWNNEKKVWLAYLIDSKMGRLKFIEYIFVVLNQKWASEWERNSTVFNYFFTISRSRPRWDLIPYQYCSSVISQSVYLAMPLSVQKAPSTTTCYVTSINVLYSISSHWNDPISLLLQWHPKTWKNGAKKMYVLWLQIVIYDYIYAFKKGLQSTFSPFVKKDSKKMVDSRS